MIITLLGVYIVILGLMTLTLLQGHKYVRNRNRKLRVLDSCSLYVVWLLHRLKRLCIMCDSVVSSVEKINMFFVCQVSELVENFNIGIWLGTTNVINVKLSMMVLLPSFTSSCHCQWPWPYFKAAAISDCINWKMCVLFQWSWNFVDLLNKWRR